MGLIEIFLNIIHGYRNVSADRKKNRPVGRTQPVNGISMLNAKVRVREVVLSVGTSQGIFKPRWIYIQAGVLQGDLSILRKKKGGFCWIGRIRIF